MNRLLLVALGTSLWTLGGLAVQAQSSNQPLLTGESAFTDWQQEQPGVRHKITVGDLPQPKEDEAVRNTAELVPKPAGVLPTAPAGFKVTLYAGGDSGPTKFVQPRLLRTAPNGDIFLADTNGGTIYALRGVGQDGRAAQVVAFATGLDHPFGIAFYPADNPRYVYVGNATTVQRLPYHTGDLHATGAPETVVEHIPGSAGAQGGGHSTRDVVFTKDGQHMLVSVGSDSNVDDPDTHPEEFHRADVLEFTPDGKFVEVYASGLRNCVGEAINPVTNELWCSTNERDNLGNYLVPDYVTSVPEHSFFGWPWYYMGGHQDPRLPQPCANGSGPNPQIAKSLTEAEAKSCKRVDMSSKVRTPDVLVQPHMASLGMTFYPEAQVAGGEQGHFPSAYYGGAFAAEHGSWNRAKRAGYNVVFMPVKDGHATGEYDDFLDGFVTKDGKVWGRPVGVAVAKDGSLIVSDDGSRSVWRVTYTGK